MNNSRPDYNHRCDASRWIACFDLLGTRQLIASRSTYEIVDIYSKAVDRATDGITRLRSVRSLWFSDTFLFYTEGDRDSDFAAIDLAARQFISVLVMQHIPVRGAIAAGTFYADPENSIHLGSTLVEAYGQGERQDWIGLTLCPSAVRQLEVVGLPANALIKYAHHSVPVKTDPTGTNESIPKTEEMYAAIPGHIAHATGQNSLIEHLLYMEERAPIEARRKYRHTIGFLERNSRQTKVGLTIPQPIQPQH